MSRRTKALLLAAGAVGTLPVALPTPATADPLVYGCDARTIRDQTDPRQVTWIEFTASVFVGTPDVTQWEITCWLQTEEDAGTTTTTDGATADGTDSSSWTNPQPDGELANTRHTCSGTSAVGGCANPVIFETELNVLYLCTHVTWTDSVNPGVVNPFNLVDHLVRDVFSTGGITTMGGTASVVATVTLGVSNLIATLTSSGGAQETHTRWIDAKPTDSSDPAQRKAGIQCEIV